MSLPTENTGRTHARYISIVVMGDDARRIPPAFFVFDRALEKPVCETASMLEADELAKALNAPYPN
jgi:hypothetical protein